jgi:hypothetical protein
MTAVGVLLLETVWIVDFLLILLADRSPAGLADYMTDGTIPRYVRGISLFHLVLPPLLLWMIHRLGYDRRAWKAQSLLAILVLPLTYLVTLDNPSDNNVNWVHGPGREPQAILPPLVYLGLLMVGLPLAVFLPTHLLLRRIFTGN